MVKLTSLNIFWIALSLIFAWGFNNVARELSSIDNGLMFLITFSSLSFILGALLYATSKDRKHNKELIYRFILVGILVISAFSITGFVGDSRASQRIMAFYSFEVFSIPGIILTHIASFLNFTGLIIFFYSSLELVYYLKDPEKAVNYDRKIVRILIITSFIVYLILSGIFAALTYQPPALSTGVINETDDTFLHISEEDWFIIINLTGFEDIKTNYNPTRFFIKHKYPITISAFAEEIPTIDDEIKCRDFYKLSVKKFSEDLASSGLNEYERDGRLLLSYDYFFGNKKMKSMNYYDYYDGYCFDFHITTDLEEDTNLNQTYSLIDSIKLITY